MSRRPRHAALRPLALALFLGAGFGATGCAPARDAGVPSANEWLSATHAAHARADAALAAGEPGPARTLLTRALEQPVPAEVRPEDRRLVHQDLLFRLSEVALADRAPADALLCSERGLALGRQNDLFSANLLVARGHALAALGRDVEAAISYRDALAIDEQLLHIALGQGAAGGP